jgi:hypothetical protein
LLIAAAFTACSRNPRVRWNGNPPPERLSWEEILNIPDQAQQAYHMHWYLKRAFEHYESMYKDRVNLNKEEWKRIRNLITQTGKDFFNQGNYPNAIREFIKIKEKMVGLVRIKEKIVSPERSKNEPCREERELDYQARRALYSGNSIKALELFFKLLNPQCLDKDDDIVKNALAYIEKRKNEIISIFQKWDFNQQSVRELAGELPPLLEEVKIFQKYQPSWAALLNSTFPQFFSMEAPGMETAAEGQAEKESEEIITEESMEKITREKAPAVSAEAAAAPEPFYPLALDLWQSAWGEDFNTEKMKPLFDYIKRNNITKVNLNPALPMSPEPGIQEEMAEKLKPLLAGLREAGVGKINYLYAELNYPIKGYLEFLQAHPELEIDMVVDDSEFTDFFKDMFRGNLEQFKNSNIHYSAFIALETLGNSGVSDEMRYWAIENVDYPILMSYLSCSLEKQQEMLEKYLEYGDSLGKKRSIGIAVLLGTKSVGREVSCEKELGEFELQVFIQNLHNWASQFESYGGIVLETNQRYPGSDIGFEKK